MYSPNVPSGCGYRAFFACPRNLAKEVVAESFALDAEK